MPHEKVLATLGGKTEERILTDEWVPTVKICFSDSRLERQAFKVRKDRYRDSGWLVWPDSKAVFGGYIRDGMNMRFQWADESHAIFAVVFQPSGFARYYDFRQADQHGNAEAIDSFYCTDPDPAPDTGESR